MILINSIEQFGQLFCKNSVQYTIFYLEKTEVDKSDIELILIAANNDTMIF